MTTSNPFPITGPDLLDTVDLDPLATETSSELQNLAQDCLHWLICLPGGNLDNIDRGVGIEQYLSGTSDDIVTLPGKIETDFRKDSRITDVAASVQLQPDGSYLIQVNVVPLAGGVVPLLFAYSNAQGVSLVSWQ